MTRDKYGRRLFKTEAKALAAQMRAMRNHGICTGVVKAGETWHLLFDPESA